MQAVPAVLAPGIAVLRCQQCNKPFDKQSTLRRHTYYCRSKTTDRSAKPRSCVVCAKEKTRCDKQRPSCSRCKDRRNVCRYPEPEQVQNSGSTLATRSSAPEGSYRAPLRQVVESLGSSSSGHEQATFLLPARHDGRPLYSQTLHQNDNSQAIISSQTPSWQGMLPSVGESSSNETDQGTIATWDQGVDALLAGSDFDWDVMDLGVVNVVSAAAQPEPVLVPSPPMTTTPLGWKASALNAARISDFHMDDTPNAVIAPHLPISISSELPRHFNPRTTIRDGARINVVLLKKILSSYPLMMLRDDTLPPFVHLHCSPDGRVPGLPGPLANCASLTRLLKSGGTGSRKLFWRMVRVESERLCLEIFKADRWVLLASVQALLVYLLIRIAEGETEHNNLDVPLLHSVRWIAGALRQVRGGSSEGVVDVTADASTAWREWIFAESRRRTAVVYTIVHMLVSLGPATVCAPAPGLAIAPLPAKRRLWEAKTAEQWMLDVLARDDDGDGNSIDNTNDNSGSGGGRPFLGLTSKGELVELDEAQWVKGIAAVKRREHEAATRFGGGDGGAVDGGDGAAGGGTKGKMGWDEWCAGMDGFGGLVVLAASLLG